MKKIIVPTGYMGSGSSAITDLVSEFKDCHNEHKSYEYIMLHCPDGLFDLEDRLLFGNNAIRSDDAIRKFETQMNKLYNKKFWWVGNYQQIIGSGFKQSTDKFISKIQEFNYPGYWYMHEEVNFKMFMKLLLRKPLKIVLKDKINFKKILRYNDGMRISFVDEKTFYQYAKEYINEILEMIAKGKEHLILDQFLLPFNLFRVDRYFDERLRVVVVERDPRDLFILNKYIWGKKNLSLPFPLEVHEFCAFYQKMRQSEKTCISNKVLRVKFEDLIYHYESEVEKVIEFLGFTKEDHIDPKKRFNPEVSIKNTQVFRKPEYQDEIFVIEEQLNEYLYEFPYVIDNDIHNTVEFE